MPTYRVEELRGALLDAAVAKAEGLRYAVERFAIKNPDPERHMTCWLLGQDGKPDFTRQYSPHAEWGQGGPIKERERIGTTFTPATEGRDDLPAFWAAEAPITHPEPRPRMCAGRTELEAAMRMRVRMKFGDTVELP